MRATWCLLSFALSSAALAAPGASATDGATAIGGAIHISALQEPVSLSGRWRVHPGDDPGWAQGTDADDALLALYLQRCEAFLRTPPPPDWDGVMNLESK